MKRIILLYFIVACLYISSIQTQPTNHKRAEETDSIYDLHHATITRTTSTATHTTSMPPTATNSATTQPTQTSSPQVISSDSPDWKIAVYGTASGISPQMSAVGAILIVIGVFLCSFGFRAHRFMLGIMGLLLFATVTWIALGNCKPEAGYSQDSITMIVVPVGVGVIGAAVFFHFWAIAMYFAGAFGGFIFAIFICSWRSDLVITNLIGRSCFLGGMGLACAVLVYFIHRPVMFFTTSFVGAYSVMFGIDCLAHVGFISGPQSMLNRNPRNMVEYNLSKFVYVLLGMTIALFLISVVWQFIFNAAYEFGLHVAAAIKGKEAREELHREEAREEEAVRDVIDHPGGDHHSILPSHHSIHPSHHEP